ncbi:MAG: DUF3617 domain-containing protein [Terriglobales bacterium]
MQSKFVIVLIVASPLALWAADKVQPMDVKVGLWEVTETTASSGQMPVPASLLEKLTPEQRARIEERMNARSGQPKKPITYKTCVTQEQIDKGYSFAEDPKMCTSTVVSSTTSKEEVRLECMENGMKLNGKAQLEAIDSEHVKAQTQFVGSGGDRMMNSTSTFSAKWLGPSCGDTK